MNKTNDFKFNLPAYSDPVDVEDLNDNFRGIDDALMAGLCKKDYTGNNMGSSDPSARKYAWAPWLEIVNDNEFDVVVTDRNAPVESEEATINIAAGQTFRKYINGRYYMNFYVQDQHDVTFKWFTDAETYINESGGGGGGTGTVTSVSVQGGSGSHLTGSGNPIETSGTITINVDEGYSIPSDNEQTAWDGKAADLKAEIDSSTYVLTLQLKDSSGNLIGNERTIDLPLETMVVDGEYDPQTQKIKLELKNGNYVEFSVADLVSGLQTELNSNNKLNPEYIAYDSTHRDVSDTEKDTWSGKQNAIDNSHKLSSDLVDDTNHTNKFVTSTEKNTWNGKQNAIDSEHKLSSSLVSFTTAEAAALASGIDSAKVAQISTNQSNILYTLGKTGRNLFELNMDTVRSRNTSGTWSGNTYTVSGLTFTFNNDGTISTTGTATARTTIVLDTYIPSSNRFQALNGLVLSGCPTGGAWNRYALKLVMTDSPYSVAAQDTGTGATIDTTAIPTTANLAALYLDIYANYPTSSSTFKPMFCTQEDWSVTRDYTPYRGVPNYDLTRLEAEDRAGLAEVVDSGAKNLLQYQNASWNSNLQRLKDINPNDSGRSWSGNVCTFNGVSYTVNSDGTISTSGTASSSEASYFTLIDFGSATSSYVGNVLSGCPTGGNYSTKYSLYVVKADGNTLSGDEGNSVVIGNEAIRWVRIIARSSTNMNGLTFKPMICTKAAFGVSNKFVPYRLPITGLTAVNKSVACSTTETSTGIKFVATKTAMYKITVTAHYGASKPLSLKIKQKVNTSASSYPFVVVESTDNSIALTATGIMTLAVGGEFEIFAAYSVASNNNIYMLVEELG